MRFEAVYFGIFVDLYMNLEFANHMCHAVGYLEAVGNLASLSPNGEIL